MRELKHLPDHCSRTATATLKPRKVPRWDALSGLGLRMGRTERDDGLRKRRVGDAHQRAGPPKPVPGASCIWPKITLRRAFSAIRARSLDSDGRACMAGRRMLNLLPLR